MNIAYKIFAIVSEEDSVLLKSSSSVIPKSVQQRWFMTPNQLSEENKKT